MANQRDNERSNNDNQSGRNDDNGDMTVREAGHKGGQRVRELVEEGKESESGGRGDNNH